MTKCVNVTSIRLSGVRVTNMEVAALASSCSRKLEVVDLSNCWQVDDDGAFTLASACPNLKHVDFRGTRLTDTGVVHIASGCSDLRSFDASQCTQVSDVGIKALVHHCANLTRLSLKHTNLSNEGLTHIGRKCAALHTLIIEGCSLVTDAGIKALVSGCVKLATLDLSETKVTNKGLEYIARKCSELTSLGLCKCSKVSDDGVKALALKCSKLHSVDLSSTSVTDFGVDALISTCANLMSLKLDKCENVSDKMKWINLATRKFRVGCA